MYKVLKSILIVILIAISIYDIALYSSNRIDKMPHINVDLPFSYQAKHLTQEDALDLCTDLVSNEYNIVFVDDLKGALGLSHIITKTAYIKNGQSGWQLLETITHELVHLKYFSVNETYTQFMTFKLLYESDNEILHNKGKEIAIDQCENYAHFNTNYDCSWYIVNYLKERGLC